MLVGGEEADLVSAKLREKDIVVVLGPSVLRHGPDGTVNVAAELRAAGVPVAFGSMGFGNAEGLPLAVARAVREGLSPGDALAGLTSTAARVAGAEKQVGVLLPGRRADLAVFSGDPFEPTSRVLAVAVRGELVYRWGDDMSGLGQ